MSNFMSNSDALQVLGTYANSIKAATPTVITYSQFQQLTPQQQESGNYMVTDWPGESTPDSYIYSLDERAIGKWVDGKTLYEKTIAITTPVVTTDGETGVEAIDVPGNDELDMCWVHEGFMYSSSYTMRFSDTWTTSMTNYQYYIRAYILVDNSVTSKRKIGIDCNRLTMSEKEGYVTIRYTKK